MENYYGMRRKRNIDLSRFHNQNTTVFPNREEEIELEEGYEYEEVMEFNEVEPSNDNLEDHKQWPNHDNTGHNSQMFINEKPFVPKLTPKKQTFADTHIRITTYLEKNVHQIIRMLKDQGQIESITKFINDSLKEHLMNSYHNDN